MSTPNGRRHSAWSTWVVPAGFAGAAIALRLALIFGTPESLPPPTGDFLDRYHPIAASLAAGAGFTDGGVPSAEAPPLYPILLAAIGAGGGSGAADGLAATRVALSIGDGLLVVVVVLLGRRLADRRTAALAGIVTAISPYFLYATFVGGNDGLFALLTTAFLLALVTAIDRPTVPRFASAGGLLGLATLCRATPLFLPLAIVPVALVAVPRLNRRVTRQGTAFLAAFVVVVAPWMVRNAVQFHAVVPVQTLGGYHLWLATVPGPRQLGRFDATPPSNDAEFYGRALGNILANPGHFVSRALRRSGRLWYATHSGLNQEALLCANLLMLALASGGVVVLRRRWRLLLPVLTVVAYFVLLHSVTVALFRYMLAVVPLLTILAAVPVVRLRDRLVGLAGASRDRH